MRMQTVETRHLTADAFKLLLSNSVAGVTIIYATGYIAKDIKEAGGAGYELERVADIARESQKAGLAYLTQKRIDEGCYEYRATRRATKHE